jgi:hypothetical protein
LLLPKLTLAGGFMMQLEAAAAVLLLGMPVDQGC